MPHGIGVRDAGNAHQDAGNRLSAYSFGDRSADDLCTQVTERDDRGKKYGSPAHKAPGEVIANVGLDCRADNGLNEVLMRARETPQEVERQGVRRVCRPDLVTTASSSADTSGQSRL